MFGLLSRQPVPVGAKCGLAPGGRGKGGRGVVPQKPGVGRLEGRRREGGYGSLSCHNNYHNLDGFKQQKLLLSSRGQNLRSMLLGLVVLDASGLVAAPDGAPWALSCVFL